MAAQPLDAVERLFIVALALIPQGLLSLANLVVKPSEPRGNGRFGSIGIRIDTTANAVRAALDAISEVGLFGAAHRFAQLRGSGLLSAGELAGIVLHLLFKPRQVFAHSLPVIRKLLLLARSSLRSGLRAARLRIAISVGILAALRILPVLALARLTILLAE